MQEINDSSKLIAQVLEIVKEANKSGVVSAPKMQEVEIMLQTALDKLTNKM